MRKLLAAAAFLGAVTAVPASAQFSANIGVVSDYRFRGVSQTKNSFALQGGLDYAHSSGLYIGTWLSTVSKDLYTKGQGLEWDIYGGWKKEFAKDWTVDVGVLTYMYPSAQFYTAAPPAGNGTKYTNTEVYVGLSYKWLSAKYYYSTSNYFGASSAAYNGTGLCPVNSNFTAIAGAACFGVGNGISSKGSSYLDLAANYEFMPKWTLNAHLGILKVKNFGGLDANDYKIGVTYDAGWASLSAAVIGTTAKAEFYRYAPQSTWVAGNGSTTDPTKTTIQLGILKTF